MSPLVTILVIMLVAVVFNESQHVTDYQDVYQNIFRENSMEFCDPAVQRKLCEISVHGWRKMFNDDNELDYVVEDAPKYIELLNDDFSKKFSQKRGYHLNKRKSDLNCETEKNPVILPDDYFPNVLANISCKYINKDKSADDDQICLEGSNCQPVIHNVRVLRRRHPNDLPQHHLQHMQQNELPRELRACWQYAYVPVEIGCRCYRL